MASSKASFPYLLFLCIVAALGGFLFGFDSAVVNGTVDALKTTFKITQSSLGFAVASTLLGSAAGAFYAGTMADKFGRRPVMFVTSIVFLISAIGTGAASGELDYVIYRVLGGIAIGAASVIAPAYISEIAPPGIRGRLSSLQQLAIVVGIFLAFASNYLIAQAASGTMAAFWFGYPAWRWMYWMEAIPALAYLLGSYFIPESPRYLVAIKQEERALRTMERVWGSAEAAISLPEIRESIDTEKKPRLSDLRGSSFGLLPVVWIGILLSSFQQFVGINVIFYYGEVLWNAAGFSQSDSLMINIVSGTVNIISTVVAIMLVDKAGRKPLLIGGSLGMVLTLGTVAIVFAMGGKAPDGSLSLSPALAWTALVAAHLYIFCFGVSWGPVVWVLLGEMFNNNIRGAALAVGAAAQWIANFLITWTFPIMLQHLGLSVAYFVYAAFALASFVFVSKFVRETKGMKLEEISKGMHLSAATAVSR